MGRVHAKFSILKTDNKETHISKLYLNSHSVDHYYSSVFYLFYSTDRPTWPDLSDDKMWKPNIIAVFHGYKSLRPECIIVGQFAQ